MAKSKSAIIFQGHIVGRLKDGALSKGDVFIPVASEAERKRVLKQLSEDGFESVEVTITTTTKGNK